MKASQVTKQAVRERDEYRCANCGTEDPPETFDVHHIVPRGRGGSNLMSNQVVLCRRCHDACHGDRMAPTVEVMSTGQMDAETFELYRRLWTEIIPTIGDQYHVPIEPIFDEETQCWHVAEADARLLFGMIEGDHRALD